MYYGNFIWTTIYERALRSSRSCKVQRMALNEFRTWADDWPSPRHGHDHDKGLKLDASTGDIYDAVTRKRCKTLKQTDLRAIQGDLR